MEVVFSLFGVGSSHHHYARTGKSKFCHRMLHTAGAVMPSCVILAFLAMLPLALVKVQASRSPLAHTAG